MTKQVCIPVLPSLLQVCKSKPTLTKDESLLLKLPKGRKSRLQTGHTDLCLTKHKFQRSILVINTKDFKRVCGWHLYESEELRTGWSILFIYSVLYSSPPTPHTHTLRDAGAKQSSTSESVSFLHTLDYRRVTCMIIADFYLAVHTVLLDKDNINIMPDLKSKWDDLDITFWEAGETFGFALT